MAPGRATSHPEEMSTPDVSAWGRLGSIAGYVAGGCFLGQTALFLADATDLLDDSPQFHRTGATLSNDVAGYIDTVADWFTLVIGALLGPAVAVLLGRGLSRVGRAGT